MNVNDIPVSEYPHRRFNPLTGQYVMVSPHRMRRPWQGQVEKVPLSNLPTYDPNCYLCPSNERAGGVTNPAYDQTYVFQNDFSALLPEQVERPPTANPLLQSEAVRGTCRVICFSPRHDLTLPELPLPDIEHVVAVWMQVSAELQEYKWVQVFQNKGAMMGSSNPHPHGQVWALDALPNEVATEDETQRAYYAVHQSPLLLDYATLESAQGERVVVENDDWLAVVPYWAVWPFEILLLPRQHRLRLTDLTSAEQKSLAAILKETLTRYDNLFETPFPYSMGWHGAPNGVPLDGGTDKHWQLHAHFYPPLLRSATVRKFMVGYELLGEAQRDLTAEQAAERLRAVSNVHYKQK